jgi:hypothetical protein
VWNLKNIISLLILALSFGCSNQGAGGFHNKAGTFEIHFQSQVAPSQGDDEVLFTVSIKECLVVGSTTL